MADATFVSRRDNAFREFPPASAQLAVIVPFYGDLTVWVRKAQERGWQFPTSTRRSGETILAVRSMDPKPSTSYVYMCEVRHVPWGYETPEDVAEIGVFVRTPRPLASEWSEVVLEAALRARRTGLR